MKKNLAKTASDPTAAAPAAPTVRPRIHPVVVYPFRPPLDFTDLEALYQRIASLAADPETFARPITVLDRKTRLAAAGNARFDAFQKEVVARHSDVLDAWCVDTCQMWYCGLGLAFDHGAPEDVYWLIPGDFNYGTAVGKEVLANLVDLPQIVVELGQDLCIGEIETDHSHSKQLIDDYGTFALLYTWFPAEAQEIRQFTERPRSEFFAIRHGFLHDVLRERWFAYEQTVVTLLQAVLGKRRISRFCVGNVSDLPAGRESLAAAVQQVERTERVLKTVWLERNQSRPGWFEQYCDLETRSEQVRRAALTVLGNLLETSRPGLRPSAVGRL
jgi:hypothetical protein